MITFTFAQTFIFVRTHIHTATLCLAHTHTDTWVFVGGVCALREQPAGGEEESGAGDSIKALQMTRRLLRGVDKVCAEGDAAAVTAATLESPPREGRDLPRGCQELSALEFLASAAAAQSVASI